MSDPAKPQTHEAVTVWSRMPIRLGIRSPSNERRPKNRLLARLSDADFKRLQPHLRTIPCKARHIFHRRGEPVREVYFLNGGVASMTVSMKNGASVEIATVGDEGVV